MLAPTCTRTWLANQFRRVARAYRMASTCKGVSAMILPSEYGYMSASGGAATGRASVVAMQVSAVGLPRAV